MQLKYIKPDKLYTGVGNRDAPIEIRWLATEIALILSDHGYTSRQGGAIGMDRAFLAGSRFAETYPPWHGFEGFPMRFRIPPQAYSLAEEILGKRWKSFKQSYKNLHARNMMEVLGPQLKDPVDFLICYTRDGCYNEATYTKETGGTGTAIICAERHGIPVINLHSGNWAEELSTFTGIDFLDLQETFLLQLQNPAFQW